MSDFQVPAEGGCQCGEIRYRITGTPLRMAVCFCLECQKQSGSAFGMSIIVRSSDFVLMAGETKSWTRTAESGRTVEQHFCQTCGCRIFHVPTWQDGVVNVRAGTLDDTLQFRPTLGVWTKRRLPFVHVDGLEAEFADHTGSSPLSAGHEPKP